MFIRSASQRDIMSHQLTFADSEFSTKRRQTRKEIFLSRMERRCCSNQGTIPQFGDLIS
jgi:transposase, IS5 family